MSILLPTSEFKRVTKFHHDESVAMIGRQYFDLFGMRPRP